jgi:hypothetical protein
MKIIVAEHFGMCFGVRDAIAQAEKLAAAGRLTISENLSIIPLFANGCALWESKSNLTLLPDAS